MEIRYKPTPEDVIHALRATSQPPWAMFLFILLLTLMFLVGIYLIDHGLGLAGWIWLAISVAIGVAVYEVPQIQARRALASNPSASGEIVLSLSDAGLNVAFATGTSQLEWRAYTKYRESDHVFLLFSGSGRSTFIPKRVMSPEQIQELRNLLRDRIPR